MSPRVTRRDFLNLAALAAGAPIFDLKPLRGVDFILQNSPTPRKFLIETMPGGVALFDYNNDGLLDISLSTADESPRHCECRKILIEVSPGIGTVSTDKIVMEALQMLPGLPAWRVRATATTAWVWQSATTTTMAIQIFT